jgi:hypothetical protein
MQWEFGDYHGRHVPDGGDAPVVIQWSPAVSRGGRVRVQDYTCECRRVVYELCSAGGVAFIRRRRMVYGKSISDEFTTGLSSKVREIWEQMLTEGVAVADE